MELSAKRKKRLLRIVRAWAIPVIIALAVSITVRVTFANPEPPIDELAQYLQTQKLDVDSESVNDHQQVFYIYNNDKFYLTGGVENHFNALSSGQYISWLETQSGQPQVILYDILNKTSLRLSNASTNLHQKMDGNRVIWQSWDGQAWQIYLYDGLDIRQISQDYTSVRANIMDDRVVYAQQLSDGWQVMLYTISTGESQVIHTGPDNECWPRFNPDGSISTNFDPNYSNS